MMESILVRLLIVSLCITNNNLARKLIVLEHSGIPKQFVDRKFYVDTRPDPAVRFSNKNVKNICEELVAADLFQLVDKHVVLEQVLPTFYQGNGTTTSKNETTFYPFTHFYPEIIHASETKTISHPFSSFYREDMPKFQTICYQFENKKYEEDVIPCAVSGANVLYMQNGWNERDYYTFEVDQNSDNGPLLRWAVSEACLIWNIREMIMNIETDQLVLERFKKRVFELEKLFLQSEKSVVGKKQKKHISLLTSFKQFETCSRLYPLWKAFPTEIGTVLPVKQREIYVSNTYLQVKILHETASHLGINVYETVEVISCFVQRNIDQEPNFYVAHDQQVDGGAFILEKSPIGSHLLVTSRAKDVPSLKST